MLPQNNLNQTMQSIIMAKRQGKSPQQVMQMMMQNNPQARQTLVQLQNMAQGRNPRDFIMDLAKQNGVDEMTLGMISQMFDNN